MCVCHFGCRQGTIEDIAVKGWQGIDERIYSEYVIRPRLVCKSILIKVLANTPPLVLSQLMRDLFAFPLVPIVKGIYS